MRRTIFFVSVCLCGIIAACSLFGGHRESSSAYYANGVRIAPDNVYTLDAYSTDRPRSDNGTRYGAATAWVDCLNETNASGVAGVVRVNSIELWLKNDGASDTLLAREDYTSSATGGGWITNPWFNRDGGRTPAFLGDVLSQYLGFANGWVTVNTGARPDIVFHLWNANYPRVALPDDDRCVYARAEMECTGAAWFSLGYDYYDTPTGSTASIVEGGSSRWYSARDGRVVVQAGP